ncbi:AAA ATPase [Natrialba chahannaoensis JCM 10990]|uniref:AAA ATPase n=1 Tax=Natrialba chahannaoensis JCM 10990 TaxID=1227492 RepID=M0AFJ6_9EURY|nr:AAA family ATPase [Natrialba chahannaoensis]ELY96647.1 AAA ATPase [Natrialba chahannaoensis JCM 10990]
MIADPRVFDDDFVPPDLLHRETEIEQLLRRYTTPEPRETDMLISGPSGVGKTLLAQKVTERLKRQRGVTTIFVDSLGKTTGAVLRSVLEQHPNGPDDVVRTTPTDTVCRKFRHAVDGGTIVVLDEGDDLPETDAINELLTTAHVTVIAIAHEGTDWLSRLDVVTSHPFDQCHVKIGRYGVSELADILERRAIQGFHGDVVSREYFEAIANEVAGVARDGIQTLRAAAEIARDQGFHHIDSVDITTAYERAKHRIRELNLESLPFHHQVLYGIIHDAGEIAGTELHEHYEEIADEIYAGGPVHPIGERARRGKFPKLKEYDLIDYDESTTKNRVYSVIDTDVEPVIDLPPTVTTY